MSPQQESQKDRRRAAAEARAAQQAAEARRDRMIKIIGGLAVVLVVGGIVGGAWWASRSSSSGTASPTLPAPNPDAAVPKGVEKTGENAWGVPLGTPKTGAPLLQVWEDFQCPACKLVEDANGAGIEELGVSGSAQLIYRPTGFLDADLAKDNAANGNPNSSHRAIAAWGCAIDAGKTAEYHNTIFANQPTKEGTGFSTQQLLDFGTTAGISGDAFTTFSQCVNDQKYLEWAVNATQEMTTAGVTGTPTGFLAGQKLDNAVLADKAKLDEAVAAATK